MREISPAHLAIASILYSAIVLYFPRILLHPPSAPFYHTCISQPFTLPSNFYRFGSCEPVFGYFAVGH
ncbi:hypothetical protein BDN71DRAFT_1438819 [Pleurotus eryngii]|uniref:Uncharacterized protein n=1 Tax=Pleurotus eryngii TaxID=5323 RepID=A0A9P6A7D4_PLEER|nr:hypothetical protein BDN71DRAFT_1438819 [Pleurotus eryngii]